MDLKGKVAVVTGGASGIGLATARLLAASGAAVAIADLNAEQAESAAAGIAQTRGTVSFQTVNVAELDSVEAMFAAVQARHGGVDILFNNAGVLGGPRFPEAKPAAWRRAIEVNLIGVMNCIHVGVPYLARRAGAVIVNTASTAGLKSSHLDPAYAMTKAGVVSLTRSLTFLAAESGIRINCVCPALVRTALESNSATAYDDSDRLAFQAGRVGRASLPSLTPEQVATAVLELVQDETLNGVAYKVSVSEAWELIPAIEPQKV